jgi:DCC1-like thiol-disulfide oxidoreductase
MAKPCARPPYSYRDDAAVPRFDDGGPLAIMDGDRALCASGARMIARRDRERVFRIGRTQSPIGAGLVRHYGLEPADPETWLFLDEGRAWSLGRVWRRSSASVRASEGRRGFSESCASSRVPHENGSTGGSLTFATGSAAAICAHCPTRSCAPGSSSERAEPRRAEAGGGAGRLRRGPGGRGAPTA